MPQQNIITMGHSATNFVDYSNKMVYYTVSSLSMSRQSCNNTQTLKNECEKITPKISLNGSITAQLLHSLKVCDSGVIDLKGKVKLEGKTSLALDQLDP